MTTTWIEPEQIGHEPIDRERKRSFKLAREFIQLNGLAERENCVDQMISMTLALPNSDAHNAILASDLTPDFDQL